MSASGNVFIKEAKRAIEWLDEPEEDPEGSLLHRLEQAWVAVAERLPKADAVVLVSDGRSLALGWLDARGVWVVDGHRLTPTHWLLLPGPPAPAVAKPRSIFERRR